jgi:hypothetical protein
VVKIGDQTLGVYSVGTFNFKEYFVYLELTTICQFISSLFKGLASIKLGFVSEGDLESGEKIQI